jgi:hypothetical protein
MGSVNNNDNQSLDGFDDMTFDDITIDDAPLPDFDEESALESKINKLDIKPQGDDNYLGKQTLGSNKQKSLNDNKENKNKKAKLKVDKEPKVPKEVKKKKKKEKIQKPQQQPKGAKTPKQVVKNSNAKGIYLNNGVVEEKAKKHTGIKLLVAIVIVAAVGLVWYSKFSAPKYTNCHITLANNTPLVADDTTEVDDSTYKVNVEDSSNGESTYVSGDNTSSVSLKIGESYDMPVLINTKLEGETEYSDHEASVGLQYTSFVSGYDNVIEYINSYNETSSKKISLADKEEFYNSFAGNDIVMYELTLTVPDDIPSNDIEHGYTGLSPVFNISIAGTDKEDALVTELYEFTVPTATDISDSTELVKLGQTYKLRYIVTMPVGLSASGYSLTLTCDCGNSHNEFTLESQDIPNNPDAVEITSQSVE